MNDYELVDCGEYGISIKPKLKDGEYEMTSILSPVKQKIKLPKMNSECFSIQYHTWDNSIIKTKEALGYIESSKVSLRPRYNQYAVMFFNDNDDYYWFHIPDYIFDELFEKIEGESK